jgi:hypothetical protein
MVNQRTFCGADHRGERNVANGIAQPAISPVQI